MRSRLRWAALFASSTVVMVAGCRKSEAPLQQTPIVDGSLSANDPANANLSPVVAPQSDGPAPQGYAVMAQGYFDVPQSGRAPKETAGTASAAPPSPDSRFTAPQAGRVQSQTVSDPRNEAYRAAAQLAPSASDAASQNQPLGSDESAQYAGLLDASVPESQQPPPPLPAYDQPEAPAQDYLWTPGYWSNASAGYFYVPGAWIAPPFIGALWTPGWWEAHNHRFRWHHGVWGRHVGYYGGINYGYGYVGYGYQGGYWNDRHFLYNQACNHLNTRIIRNTYVRDVTLGHREYLNNTRASFAGDGGVRRGPAAQELAAQRESFLAPMHTQMEQQELAAQNRGQFFNVSRQPQVLAVAGPLQADRNLTLPRDLVQAPGALRTGVAGERAGDARAVRSVVDSRPALMMPAPQPGVGNRSRQPIQGYAGEGTPQEQVLSEGGYAAPPVTSDQGYRAPIGQENRGPIGQENRGNIGQELRGGIGQEPRGGIGSEPRGGIGQEQRRYIGQEPGRQNLGIDQGHAVPLGVIGGYAVTQPVTGERQRGLEQQRPQASLPRGQVPEQRRVLDQQRPQAIQQRQALDQQRQIEQQTRQIEAQRQQVEAQQRVFEQRQQLSQQRVQPSVPRQQALPQTVQPVPQSVQPLPRTVQPLPQVQALPQRPIQPVQQPQMRAPMQPQMPHAETARPMAQPAAPAAAGREAGGRLR